MNRNHTSLPLLLAGTLAACWSPESPPQAAKQEPASTRPNIVLISIDTLRRDHTTPYGYERETTPELAKLTRDAARFETAYSHTPTTGPSHATMLTARLPIGTGVVNNGAPLSGQVRTLAEILKGEGYQTIAFVSSYVLSGKFGFERGFELYDDELAQPPNGRELTSCAKSDLERCADQTVDAALHWLDRNRDPKRPLFLFIHFFDPHKAYSPPSSFGTRFLPEGPPKSRGHDWRQKTALYDSEIVFTDQELGRLLEGFDRHDLRSNTILLLTADHGEALGAHGIPNHGLALYEELLRVPLVVRYPGHVEAGKVLEEPVGLFDVTPTLLELAGIDAKSPEEGGRSLAGALLGRATLDPERPIFLQRRHYETEQVMGRRVKGDAFGVRIGHWKYLETEGDGKRELYDLATDPLETKNLIDSDPERAQAMTAALDGWKRAQAPATGEGAPERPQVSESDRRKLRALGYVE